MALKIGSALSGGLRRIANRNGLAFLVAFSLLALAFQVMVTSLAVNRLQGTGYTDLTVTAPTVDAPTSALAAGAVLCVLALTYLNVVAIRTFVARATRSIPPSYLTRKIGWVLLNLVVGGIAVGVLVTIGTVFLLIPGVIAYVAFLFTTFFVAVEDENFVAALRDSWELTRGNWLRLFFLVAVVFVGLGIISTGVSVMATEIPQPTGTVVSTVVSLVTTVVTLGILADAFDQLRSDAGAI